MAKIKRGKPSKKKRHRKARHQMKYFEKIHPDNTIIRLSKYPDSFKSVRSGAEVLKVHRKLLKSMGIKSVDELPVAPASGLYVVKPPKSIVKTLPKDHPKVLIVRSPEGIVPSDVQAMFLAQWERIQACNVTPPRTKDSNRKKSKTSSAPPSSTSDAYHWASWGHSASEPYVTSDTKQKDPKARMEVEEFLRLIKVFLVPIIKKQMMIHSPNLWKKHVRAYEYVEANINDPLDQWDSMDFGGVFFTVAAKEGSSDEIHLDFHDHKNSLTWVVPFGDWEEGGEFVAPEIGAKIPVRPGQVLGAMTGRLAHAGSNISGGRHLVLTLFTDKTIVSRSQKTVP